MRVSHVPNSRPSLITNLTRSVEQTYHSFAEFESKTVGKKHCEICLPDLYSFDAFRKAGNFQCMKSNKSGK